MRIAHVFFAHLVANGHQMCHDNISAIEIDSLAGERKKPFKR